MRENRLYGSEGGGALTRSPYPHRPTAQMPRFARVLLMALTI